MKYSEFKAKQAAEMNEFPMGFAFSDKQLNELLEKWDCKKDDLCSTGAGCIMRKTDSKALDDLYRKLSAEQVEAMKDDAFLTEAIRSELSNHEYIYTSDNTDALRALGLTQKDLETERIGKCYTAAREEYMQWCEENDI